MYVWKVVGPNNISFHMEDRYSSIRSYQQTITRNLEDDVSLKNVPKFPAKKYMNSMSDAFLNDRMQQLQLFLNGFLKIKEVASNNLTLTYFHEKAVDQEGQNKIKQLTDYIVEQMKKQKRNEGKVGNMENDIKNMNADR